MPHYENVPFEVPEGWVCVYLNEIAFIGTGSTPSKSNKGYYGGSIPWISSSATNLPIITKATDYITEKALEETNCQLYPKGTLIMAMYGEGKTRGQVSELGFECCTNQACAAILPFLHETGKYIKSYFESQYYRLRALAEGGNQPNLNLAKISSYIIPLPPIAEQFRIVKEVDHWFTLIDQTEQGKVDLQAAIKQAKSKILDLAIHGKLVPQDPNDEPASELLKRINPKAEIACDNGQYGKIPKGWCLCRLGDIGKIVTGNTPTKDIAEYYGGNIPFYKPADLEEGKCIKNASDHLSVLGFEQARKIPANSILVTCIGATIGKTGLITVEGSCNQQINAIIPNEAACAKFIYYTCISDYMQKEIKSNASATTLPILNKGNFAKLPFPLPPYNEQHRIVTKIEELFTSLENIQKALEV